MPSEPRDGGTCANCGAPRRHDGLSFCAECGLPYAQATAVPTPRPQPRTFWHPWAVLVWLGVLLILVATLFSEVTFWVGSFTTTDKWLALPLVTAGWLLYWSPTLVAVFRRRTRVWTVGIANLLWAWTVLGWLLVLWMASGGATHPTNGLERRSA